MFDMNHDNKIDSRDHYLFDQVRGVDREKTPKRFSLKQTKNKKVKGQKPTGESLLWIIIFIFLAILMFYFLL